MPQTNRFKCLKPKETATSEFRAFEHLSLSVCFGFPGYGNGLRRDERISDFVLLVRNVRPRIAIVGFCAALLLSPTALLAADDPKPAVGAPIVRLVANLEAKGQQRPLTVARSKSALSCAVNGREGAEAAWQLAYDDSVVKQGKVKLDAQGRAMIDLVLPEVRVRSTLKLIVRDGELSVSHPIMLLPLQTLAPAKEAVKELGLGVADLGGNVQKALVEEGAEAEALISDLARDAFTGGCAVLGGYAKADDLAWVCGTFEGRVKKGMTLVIVNPPAGWQRWGLRCIEPNRPIQLPVRFAARLGAFIEANDLGAGPWLRFLEADANVRIVPLAWLLLSDANVAAHPQARTMPAGGAGPLGSAPPLQIDANLTFDPLARGLLSQPDAWVASGVASPPAPGGREANVAATDANSPQGRPLLIAFEKIENGRVVVMVLPQLEDPSASAVGGALLGEIVQWVIQVRGEPHN
jgi:hypothetical protein